PGVYAIFAHDGRIGYIGAAGNLHKRLAHGHRVASILCVVKYRPCASRDEAVALEARLVRRIRPLVNRTSRRARKPKRRDPAQRDVNPRDLREWMFGCQNRTTTWRPRQPGRVSEPCGLPAVCLLGTEGLSDSLLPVCASCEQQFSRDDSTRHWL